MLKRAIVGIPIGKKDKTQTLNAVTAAFGKDGRIVELRIEREEEPEKRFKMGNLDSMMVNYDSLVKFDNNLEGILRRLEKAYVDLNPNNSLTKLKVHSKESGELTIDKYLGTFRWDDARFPRSHNIDELIKMILHKAHQVDATIKVKNKAYIEAKLNVTNLSKRDAVLVGNKDLGQLLSFSPHVSEEIDFLTTPHLKPLVAIVPRDNAKIFLGVYEKIHDYVVPASAKELKVNADIGNVVLFRVYLVNPAGQSIEQEFIDKMLKQHGIVVKSVVVSKSFYEAREKEKVQAETNVKTEETNFKDALVENFKDIYNSYIHLKVLKASLDAAMRFGTGGGEAMNRAQAKTAPGKAYFVALLEMTPGQEKKILTNLTNLLIDAGTKTKGLYGTKEELEDSEDFYPFSFVNINISQIIYEFWKIMNIQDGDFLNTFVNYPEFYNLSNKKN